MDSTTFFRDGDGEDLRPLAVRPEKAAELLGISISALHRLYKARELPRYKHGGKVFYLVSTLEAWLAAHESFAQDGAAEEPRSS